MARALQTYDPKSVSISIASINTPANSSVLSGFAEGTMIKLARNADAFSLHVGVDGQPTRSKSNNRSATITVSLMQTSASMAFLNSIAETDENSINGFGALQSGTFSLMVKDNNNVMRFSAAECWIKKRPEADFEKDAKAREWVFECGEVTIWTDSFGTV